jgi:glycosyltransferase involved in cell wall biosynthesis
MQLEYVRHGFAKERVHVLPYGVVAPERAAAPRAPGARPWSVLFGGRMDELKGGGYLLEAIRLLASAGGPSLHAVFAGDGPARAGWERRATALVRALPGTRIEFTGWVNQERRDALLLEADVAVVPSIWPEPFGRIGAEAALAGVPVVAFDVGGVREWLLDGVNGFLAPSPPSAKGLAVALRRLLDHPALHPALAQGARQVGARFRFGCHVDALLQLMLQVAST